MKYGIREICDVVLKAKSKQKIGNKTFFKNEPVIYFDSLKTSSLEGASTTVYAQGGRGNTRLMAWEGERTLTFTMEDALISPEGFMILSGAGLIDAASNEVIKQHMNETVAKEDGDITITGATQSADGTYTIGTISNFALTIKDLNKPAYVGDKTEAYAYVFFMKDGEIVSEPYLAFDNDTSVTSSVTYVKVNAMGTPTIGVEYFTKSGSSYESAGTGSTETGEGKIVSFTAGTDYYVKGYNSLKVAQKTGYALDVTKLTKHLNEFDAIMVDYYTEIPSGAKQIDITADSFGGNFYLEASTLWRKQNGSDVAAEFIIPNCKVQSNFTFTMASSGDPSTFTFTLDAFPDYTRFDRSKKVLAAIQIVDDDDADNETGRTQTWQN